MLFENTQTVPTEQRELLLRAAQIFVALDETMLSRISNHMQESRVARGEIAVREGDKTDHFFVIAEGRAEVSIADGDKNSIVGTLEPGEFFGEMALLNDSGTRQATVTALRPLLLLSLDSDSLRQILALSAELSAALDSIAEIRTKMNFLKQSEPFRSLTPAQIKELISKLETVKVDAGTDIIRQGEAGQTCYLIRSGQVDLLRQEPQKDARRIATLSPGSLFGEASAIMEAPHNATVRAKEQCELLALHRRDLVELMNKDNQFNARLFSLLKHRSCPHRIDHTEALKQITSDGQIIRVLRCAKLGIYARLTEDGWFIWERLDGNHTLEDISQEFKSQRQKTITPDQIAVIVAELSTQGFLKNKNLRPDIPPAAETASGWQRISAMLRRIFN